MNFTISELESWDEKIRDLVERFELDPFPQVFELCDYDQMIGYTAYSGMPSRYPHWSFGKQFERQKTMYSYGVAGLPYEMVINSNPCLAYLMQDNTLLLQVLTIAHVYAHNDFFRHNINFSHTRPEFTLEKFKAHADRIRKYNENPRIGFRPVENLLDAAHTLSLNCDRHLRIKRLSRSEQIMDSEDRNQNHKLEPTPESKDDDTKSTIHRNPLESDPNLLLFIRDYNPFLAEWEKDILSIVHEETQYFIPQIETKIMNEGWASIWHKRIIDTLDMPEEMRMEFFVRHNQVMRPIPRSLNQYHLGYKLLEDVERRWNKEAGVDTSEMDGVGSPGREKLFQVRETDRDESFLRQYMTKDLMVELDLYVHEDKGRDRVVTKVASDEDWKEVRDQIIASTGMNGIPIVKVKDADYKGRGRLLLEHEYEGRELEGEYAKKTLSYIQKLWRGPVILETAGKSGKIQLSCESSEDEIEIKAI